jgi:hypothetical protein
VRVLLGEPPIAWERIRTREDFLAILSTRDSHAAGVIQGVLARKEKALVIYGGGHFGRVSAEEEALRAEWAKIDPQNARAARLTLQGLVEAEHPGAFFVVREYIGFDDDTCAARFEERMKEWPMPALAVSARATTLERDIDRCRRQDGDTLNFPEAMPEALQDLLRAQINDDLFTGDAILFVSQSANLTESAMLPDLYFDDEYREEISRRVRIRTGEALPEGWGGKVPFTPGVR